VDYKLYRFESRMGAVCLTSRETPAVQASGLYNCSSLLTAEFTQFLSSARKWESSARCTAPVAAELWVGATYAES